MDTVDRLIRDICTPARIKDAEQGLLDREAWTQVADAGLPLALAPEAAGGFGMAPEEALQIACSAGEHLLPLPLCETMLAAWALGTNGLPICEGPLAITPAGPRDQLSLQREGADWRLTGAAQRVPWARHAEAIVVLAAAEDGLRIAQVKNPGFTIRPGQNLAMEPRDTVTFDAYLPADTVATAANVTLATLRAAGAVMRSLQMSGALTRLSEMTIQYAQDRVQFGKSLSKFQVIQHNIAVLATQAAAASSAASLAAEAFADGLRMEAIAAAKSRIGEAAGIAAPIAHQIHGAMGFTYEHQLHFVTKRLLSWREEFGNEREWRQFLGARIRSQGADKAWQCLSAI